MFRDFSILKKIIFALCFLILLTGCNIPGEETEPLPDILDKVPGDGNMIEETDEDSETSPAVMDEENLYAVVPVEDLILWSEPSVESAELGRLLPGETVVRLDELGDNTAFYHVRTEKDGTEGYLSSAYCTPVHWRFDDMDELSIVDVSEEKYTYQKMEEDLKELKETYPEILQLDSAGKSVCGREIYRITLGNTEAPGHIFIDASIHGREYLTTVLTMKLVEYYASQYDKGCYKSMKYSDLFDRVCLTIYPMVNPDGVSISQFGEEAIPDEAKKQLLRDCYEYDRQFIVYLEDSNGTYYWEDGYKTISPIEDEEKYIPYEDYLTQWKSNANGTDLNNNFDCGWEEADYKNYPSFGKSKGEKPVSEPESEILYEESRKKDYCCFINYHTRGQILYYDSYGMTESLEQESYELASKLQELTRYIPYSTSDHEVDKAGFGDYVHINLNKPGVTIEVGRDPSPVPIREISGTFTRNRETWAMLASFFLNE